MKYFSIFTLLLMITLIVSACGAKATPPPALSAIDMQITAAAVALTMYAETQAAVPTATPIPPTETPTNTPLPTVTPLSLPSSGVTFTPLPNSNAGGGGGDECSLKPMPQVLHGETVKMRINNSTKATMRLSVYLNDTTQCGYRAYNLEPGGSLVLTDLVEGCYTLYAWNVDPDDYFIVTNGTTCIDNSVPSVFDISTRDIRQR